jgi:bifunctional DNase/RNase
MDIPVELSRILITELGEQQVIFLKEKDGERSFPILVGISEALAIDRRLKDIQPPRPMTHDLLAGVIGALGGRLEKITVTDLRDHTFIAVLTIRCDGKVVEIDSRPSDAIALGAAMDTPMFVAEKVFDTVTANGAPASRAERLDLLRQRKDALAEQISALGEILGDEGFLANAPPDAVREHRQHLDSMRTEYEAIERILEKLG